MKTPTYLRSSSLYKRASDSFCRSKGCRGANIETLRGNSGADFECEAIVNRGKWGVGLFLLFWKKSTRKDYIVVKGPYIFVYKSPSAPAPKFAIPLKHETVEMRDVHGKSQVVSLKTGLGDIEYEFKFDLSENKNLGKVFCRILKEQINVGNCYEVKKRLGHSLQCKSKSLVFAKSVAEKKEADQPKKTSVEVKNTLFDEFSLMRSC